MNKTPLAPWPFHDEDEIEAVNQVLRSGKVNYWNGTEGRRFEQEFADWCGSAHAVVVANGTVALELALEALGIGEGDEVIVPSRSFVATATCVVTRGALPVFADVDRDSGNITATTISKVLSERTKAIIPVHVGGWPCDMPEIMELARRHNLKVVEDCAQAHGAKIEGKAVGTFGDFGSFSFCTDKIISTGGEGGMLITDDAKLWQRAWSYKDHGRSYDAVYKREHPPGFRWLIEAEGTNWRLSEMQSAIGRLQLRKLDSWLEARRKNAGTIADCLSQFPCVRVPRPRAELRHAYYKLYAYTRDEQMLEGWSRDRVMTALEARGAPGLSGVCPEIYREKIFEGQAGTPEKPFDTARELGETSLMFPVHHTMGQSDLERVCSALEATLAEASVGSLKTSA